MTGPLLKLCSVVGARPQFVKAGAVAKAMTGNAIDNVLIHTGQHYDFNMSEVFFRELDLAPPAHNLGVGSGSHAAQTARMLEGLEPLFERERPDAVLVYGDTNSTLAATLAAVKLGIPVAHVEAGLRSFNRAMPEEINRIVADSVCDLLFAPTVEAMEQLRREGQPEERIRLSGDVMYDAALMTADLARRQSSILDRLGLTEKGFLLATIHRAENTDDPRRLSVLIEALELAAEALPVVLPLHPRTRAALDRLGILQKAARRLKLIEPVGFIDMVRLEMSARTVATDSGGVQKEAFFYRVPCCVLRNETEWRELLEAGWNRLLPPGDDPGAMAAELLAERPAGRDIAPYGKGDAGRIIVETLLDRYGRRSGA
ncbi:UDP-N-acetylglucosamine 2-epimerase [Azospirillum sp. TSH7]|uniref:non-hydrolyzing UDP-N-acetylglucosamine 2-epimerase n=1 Tax=unclassified Azospirillum TaxID=2630922 RepID=UPI000D61594A|nr:MULTISPECIES: UDP-N-acetylglucosamine 2-epimerase (non-hydrolyzing) [unclassified Azospirillum]PWC57258.1 UDP-N-acetylglucosamine 2-epimerase [Azospirillum sp. TSH7]PWC71322.1 UDP-N-acetylglucosamine 2-epimerase [Azospirillum sp. TSH20]